MLIYKITNKKNGKMYIGATSKTIQDRWYMHKHPKNKTAIAEAIRKYGEKNFCIEKIDDAVTILELQIKEAAYIKAFKTLFPDGYNLHPGGKSRKCHPATKKKISDALKGRPFKNRWTKGNKTPKTPEQKAYLRALFKGKPNVTLYKKVQCIETGKIYESVNAAAKAHKVNRVTMSHWIKTKTHGRIGLTFRFI